MHISLITIITVALMMSSCGDLGYGSERPNDRFPDQTQILEIRVDPNPVVGGDTTRITCVIEDSLDTRFTFLWLGVRGGKVVGFQEGLSSVETDSNSILWIPDPVTEEKLDAIVVDVDNGVRDSLIASKSFEVTVLPN